MPARTAQIILYQQVSLSYYVAQSLETFDREFRRTVAEARQGQIPVETSLLRSLAGDVREPISPGVDEYAQQRSGRSLERGPRPAPPQSGLQLIAAAQGSSFLGMVPWGEAVGVLNSAPLSAILNTAALWSAVRRVRFFFNRDPLAGVSAREAIDVLREFDGLPDGSLGAPDQELNLEVDLPDGTQIRGAREVSLRMIDEEGRKETWVHIVGDRNDLQ